MYMNEHEAWAIERKAIAAKLAKAELRAAQRKAIEKLPTRSQRVIARFMLAFSK